jgi:hypothetical protein
MRNARTSRCPIWWRHEHVADIRTVRRFLRCRVLARMGIAAVVKGMRRQDRIILRYLQGEGRRLGRMPTYKEACADLDMCRGQLTRHLKRLVEFGALAPIPNSMHYRLV